MVVGDIVRLTDEAGVVEHFGLGPVILVPLFVFVSR